MAGREQSSEKAALEEAGELGRGAKTLVATIWIKTEVQWEVTTGCNKGLYNLMKILEGDSGCCVEDGLLGSKK